MAYKLSFKINRSRYTGNAEDINRKINQELIAATNTQRIETLRIFQPSGDSIKALFPDEKKPKQSIAEKC